MSPAKIRLSATERELLCNYEWILTKNAILQKTGALLIHLQPELEKIIAAFAAHIPAAALATRPKLSRGENYRGLPYLVLDYPRLFTKTDVFAIRTMFWWGHFFSVTLHLKGKYKKQYLPILLKNFSLLGSKQFYVCVSAEEWRHEFEEDNYKLLTQLNSSAIEEILLANNFCKLSAKISLPQWNQSKELLIDLHETVIKSIGC